MMNDIHDVIAAGCQISLQCLRIECIDAEDNVRHAVLVFINADMRDIGPVSYKYLGNLSDGTQLVFYADRNTASFFTIPQNFQKCIEHIVLR